MSFKNIFDSGMREAASAEQSAEELNKSIPGASGASKAVHDLESERDDPKIVRETSFQAQSIAENFLTPMFKNFQTVAADQGQASENPESTSNMASSIKDQAFKAVNVEISDENLPDMPDLPEPDMPDVPDVPKP